MDAFLRRLTVEQRGVLAHSCPSCGHCELLANGRFSHGNIRENMRKSTFSAGKSSRDYSSSVFPAVGGMRPLPSDYIY